MITCVVPLNTKSGTEGSTSPAGVIILPVPVLLSIVHESLSASAALIIYSLEVVIWLFVTVISEGYLVLDAFESRTPIPLSDTIVFLSTTIPSYFPCWWIPALAVV